jgi:hypothetical protein
VVCPNKRLCPSGHAGRGRHGWPTCRGVESAWRLASGPIISAASCRCAGTTLGANGEALAISVPAGETRVLKHFQERMPYGLFVPDVA